MSNILKDIYQSYGYKENEVFKPVKIGCSMAGIEILDKLVKNAPASADTFAYVYYDKGGYITYEGNENLYPTFNVKENIK